MLKITNKQPNILVYPMPMGDPLVIAPGASLTISPERAGAQQEQDRFVRRLGRDMVAGVIDVQDLTPAPAPAPAKEAKKSA